MPRTIDPERLARYENAVARLDGIKRKGKANPYTAVNGHMFSFLDEESALCVRLSPEAKAEFAAEFGDAPVMQYGSVMRGYVTLPESIAADPEALHTYLRRAMDYVLTLKPK
ncbi:MAG: hypothetical protein AAF848_13285 [Pseudomonadota bacterium]